MIDEAVRRRAKYIEGIAKSAGFDAPLLIQHEMLHAELSKNEFNKPKRLFNIIKDEAYLDWVNTGNFVV